MFKKGYDNKIYDCSSKKYGDDYNYDKKDCYCPKKCDMDKEYDYEWKCYGYKKCYCYLEKNYKKDYSYESKCDGCKKSAGYKKDKCSYEEYDC